MRSHSQISGFESGAAAGEHDFIRDGGNRLAAHAPACAPQGEPTRELGAGPAGDALPPSSPTDKAFDPPRLFARFMPRHGRAKEAAIDNPVITVESSDLALGSNLPSLGGPAKRAMDIAVASLALVLVCPLMLMLLVLVHMSMGGPALFAHRRVGCNGKAFRCFKFRTMVANADEVLQQYLASNPDAAAEWATSRKLMDDPRVTALGRLLRKSSLDELPQLINILRGEMSCVGPRPVTADELERYGSHARDYLSTRPGLTGMWQISGRSLLTYEDRVALDSKYVHNWSLWMDIVIMLKTIPAVINAETAA